MAGKNHLLNLGGVYYYRRRVPDRLIARIGRKVIKFSLRTRDKVYAIKLREIEDVKTSALFAKAMSESHVSQSAPDGSSVPKPKMLSSHQALRLAWEYVARTDARSIKWFNEDGPATDNEREEMKQDVEFEIDRHQSLDDPGAGQSAFSQARKLLVEKKLFATAPDDIDQELLTLINRGHIELAKRRLARLEGHHSSHFDPIFNPDTPPSLTVGELANELLDEKHEDAKINGGSKKALEKHKASLGLIVEILGQETSVSSIGYNECKSVRATLARVPTNRTKLLKGLSLAQAIESAEADGLPCLAPITQQTYLLALKDLLELARLKGLVKTNHAAGMKPIKRDAVAAGDKRAPFTLDQIAKFFNGKFYTACASGGPKPYAVANKDWRFWLPLLCLFMGLRPNEVCQLRRSDVRVTPSGVPYLDVVASPNEGEKGSVSKKTLKTETSRRKVPVHSELVKLGFMDFVAEQQSSDALLFSVKPDKDGNHARYALKRFNEAYLPAEIELMPKQVFYSFRHSFADALRRSNAPPEIMRAFGGWSDGAKVSDAYGEKYNPDHTVAHMGKITFPGLDLSHLAIKE